MQPEFILRLIRELDRDLTYCFLECGCFGPPPSLTSRCHCAWEPLPLMPYCRCHLTNPDYDQITHTGAMPSNVVCTQMHGWAVLLLILGLLLYHCNYSVVIFVPEFQSLILYVSY